MRLFFLALLAMPFALKAQCPPPTQKLIVDRKFDEAATEARATVDKNGSDEAALHCMGRVLLEQNKSGEAVDWFEKAVKVNDRSALHHLWLGNALGTEAQKANKLRQPFLARRVKTEFERAVALDPTLIDARHGLVQFYTIAPGVMGGSVDKAREQIAEIEKLNPMRGHFERAALAERDKDLATAEREYVAATTLAPDSVVAFNTLGAYYRRQKKWPEAIAAYERVLTIKPDAYNAHLSLGGIAAASGQNLDLGEREIKEWLARAPKDAPILNVSIAHQWLGKIYETQGKKDAARAEYQLALSANPKNEDAKKALAALK
jgi:tetratricopeptide (TPR) repeat protein